MQTYAPLAVAFTRGKGAWLWDADGNKYLDALSGIAVCGLGHAHPAVTRAICEQAGDLIHVSNLYEIARQHELAERLTALAGMDRAFFCNSGAEANETAIKLARLHGHRQAIDAPAIVVMDGGFHGRTLATLSATGNRKMQAGFGPLFQGFKRVPYNELGAVRDVAENSNDVVAVLVEPIQGEAGIVIPDTGYLQGLRRICDQHGWLLMLDEIQTGMCRTGKWFAFQHEGIVPDLITLAKGLGNGVPIGACLARGGAAEVLQPGSHGSTFGGNPLACRAALAVIETLETEMLADRAARLGDILLDGLRTRLDGQAHVRAVRGLGLMLAVELDRPCRDLMPLALQRGLLINVTAENVVRLLPPLILSDDEAGEIVRKVGDLITGFMGAL